MQLFLTIIITAFVSIVSVIGYLYSTGSILNWAPKKKV